jgi:hypothetical protein
VSQMALAFLLLCASVMLVHQMVALSRADLGFAAPHLWTFQVTLPVQRYATGPKRTVAARQMLERLRQVPGVIEAGGTTVNPLAGWQWNTQVITPELESAGSTVALNVNDRLVTPEWFDALGIRVIGGRPFSVRDDDTAPPVVVVSRRLAQHLWPASDAVGKRIRNAGGEGGRPSPWRTVVGVVADVRDAGDVDETWYVPYAQRAGTADGESLYLMVRTRPDAALRLQTALRAVHEVDPDQAVSDFAEMEDIRVETLVPDRLSTTAVSLIAACGLLLTLIGAFGASNYVANLQKHETGVRLMLGATTRDIVVPQAWRSVKTAIYGIAAGEALALFLRPFVAAFGGTLAVDRVDVLAIGLLLLLTSVGASLLPTWRGTHADPLNALRQQ